MGLSSGTRLGPYEILSPAGKGGMGEVYRARDTRLERTVAIKILPAHLSANPESKLRFEREAKAISSLNHPHICALYDVGHQDGTDFLVMEYLEGESLAERLERGALPLEQLLRYAVQIADALDRAHRQGLVHRDLKPGNIMLTKSGAKLLDFGLAKAATAVPISDLTASISSGASGDAAAAAQPVTARGTIVGTFQYMSPEQIQGVEADARSDIFALGAVLYEMATGRRAFPGKSQASVIAAILAVEPPPISSLQPVAPVALDRLVKKCLEKDPAERWQSAHDLKASLEWIAQGGPAATKREGRKRATWALWLAAMAVVGALLFAAGHAMRSRPQAQPIRAALPPPPNAAFIISSNIVGSLALSPNGRMVVFAAQAQGSAPQLWLRFLDSVEPHPLAGTEYAQSPFWSPDNRWIAFFSSGKLKKVEAASGLVETICESALGRGGTWNRDGLILFSPNVTLPLFQVPATGGVPTALTRLDSSRQEITHRWPQFLPDGKHYLLFIRAGAPSATGVYLGTLGSDQRAQVLSSSTNAVYAPPGYLLYSRGDALVAQAFDLKRIQTTGEPAPLARDVSVVTAANYVDFSVSETGTLIFSSGTVLVGRQFSWYDRQGKQLGKLGAAGFPSWPQLSPDGKKLAARQLIAPAATADIWVYDTNRGVPTRMSFMALDAYAPLWSPSGAQLAYAHSSPQTAGAHMYIVNADGNGKEEPLEQPVVDSLANYPSSFSPDGHLLLFDRQDKSGKTSIWVVPLAGDRKAYPFLETKFSERFGQFSPDGRWVAYVSNDSGKEEVYVVPFPGPGGRVRVSTAGGSFPRWRRNGRELFYVSGESKIIAAEVELSSGEFRVGTVRELFSLNYLLGVPGYPFDVTADGQRFISLQDIIHPSTTPLTMVINWPAAIPSSPKNPE